MIVRKCKFGLDYQSFLKDMENPRNVKNDNTDSNSQSDKITRKCSIPQCFFWFLFLSNTYKDDKVSLRGIIKTTGLQDSQLSRSSKYIQNLAS